MITFISVLSVVSNKGSINSTTFLIFFQAIYEIKRKLSDVYFLKSEIVSQMVLSNQMKSSILKKIFFFLWQTNSNTDFVDSQHHGKKNSVLTILRNLWSRNALELFVVKIQFILCSNQLHYSTDKR